MNEKLVRLSVYLKPEQAIQIKKDMNELGFTPKIVFNLGLQKIEELKKKVKS
jgi:hypothetical protein